VVETVTAPLAFEFVFEFARIRDGFAVLRPNQGPRTPIFRPARNTVVMITQPLVEIGRHADIEAPSGILDDIDPCHLSAPKEEVAGAGFEPAIRQLPDYEPEDLLFDESMTFKKKLRGRDLNPRPSGYEPDELPGCSTPRFLRNGTMH
jgi:hypothetical protein